MKRFLRIGLLMAVVIVGVSPMAMATGYDEEWDYYADATLTPPSVGARWIMCNGSHGQWGTITEYFWYEQYTC